MQDSQQPHPLLVQLFTEASAYQSQGNLHLALVAYKRIQRQFPDFVDAWTNGSIVLNDLGRSEEALEMALRAVELGPENPTARCALANAQQKLGNLDDASTNFQKVIQLDPNHVPALSNLAGIYNRQGLFVEAMALDDKATQLQPSDSALWGNRGHTKMRAMNLEGAESDFIKSLELDNNNALPRWNLAYVQLLQHRYHDAWPNFSARRELIEWVENKCNVGKPQWNGEPLEGRRLFIYSEQGFGDTIQFSRFIPRLRQYGGKFIFSTHWMLKRLLSGLPGVDDLVIEGEQLPEFDLAIPLMELPTILDVGLVDLVPLPPPALPEPQTIPELDRPGFKVGLTWAGSRTHTNDALRSMDPIHLDELADMEGIAWYGLQLPKATVLPNLPGIIDLSHHMNDFMDTAQLIRQLDLVITVDTSMSHLAGFLGLPAVVLLAFCPDWRWGATGSHTPWYPSLTLLRQPAHGDWKSVIGELKTLITEPVISWNR